MNISTPSTASDVLPRHPRYLSLDLWRGVACLAVVFFHSALFCYKGGRLDGVSGWLVAVSARGWVGVPVFFVISGYCISATADSARRKQRAVSTYFMRRFRRIFPPYWIFLACSVAFVLMLRFAGRGDLVFGDFGDIVSIPDLGRLQIAQWLGNLTLTETWRYHVIPPGPALMMGHAWTLCYEEQFYAVTGLLLLVAPRRFFLGTLLTSLAVIACTPLGLATRGFFWDGRWLLFAAGVGVYYTINYGGVMERRLLLAALLAGIACDVCKLAGWLGPSWTFVGMQRNEPLAAFCFALVALTVHHHDAAIASSPVSQPLLVCGRMCYSLYLVHFPIVLAISHAAYLAGFRSSTWTTFVTIPVCVTASVIAGWTFHTMVERRFLNPPN